MVPPTTAQLDSTCAVCGKACRKLRCSKCRNVTYCSVDCQRVDWNAGHKVQCAATAAAARRQDQEATSLSPQAAWDELLRTLTQMTPQEAHQRFQMAQDEIKRLKEQETTKTTTETSQKQQNDVETAKHRASSTSVSAARQTDSEGLLESKQETVIEGSSLNHRHWFYVVEEMPNISSYQVSLWPKTQTNTLPAPSELAVSMQVGSQGNTSVTLRSRDTIIFSATFAGRLEESPEMGNTVQRQSDCLSLRLRSHDCFDVAFTNSAYTTTPLAAVYSICCRYCNQPLLSHDASRVIHKVLPLPKGHWDEVTDYIICYNGQPAVDFSSSSTTAQEHLALEDSALIVLHRNNVGNGVSVLAVEGYGDYESNEASNDAPDNKTSDSATYRGPRTWRDAVGGATLCCSQCCTVLGFASVASPETFRLLKHRLSVKEDLEWTRLYTCASFVAHEIVRYAESKAIYTFVISVRPEETTNSYSKCILLRLLSWDTRQAKSMDSFSCEKMDQLAFKRVVKVIYEIADDRDAARSLDADDPMKWSWGGVDLCCMPDGTRFHKQTKTNMAEQALASQASAASVRLWLSQDEWNELHETLVGSSQLFSKSVADATILVKLGQRNDSRDDDVVGLGALPLP